MKKYLATILFSAALALVASVASSPATPAYAASGTQCGAAYCTISTSIQAESSWREDITANIKASGTPANSPEAVIKRKTYNKACDSWLPVGGGKSVKSYPLTPHTCNFTDGGVSSGGSGTVWWTCAPRGGRSANGRVTVYQIDPTTGKEVYGYYLCFYPDDAHAPIERNVGQGEIATGGKGDMVKVNDPNSAPVFASTGLVTDTTNYVNRGVNLSNPEAYTGSWSIPFAAKTGMNPSGLPVYGYYSLKMAIDYRICVKWAYPSWLGQPARYDCSKQGQHQTVTPYTYACNINPALQQGIVAGAEFIPSRCAPAWECVMSAPILINGIAADTTTMRNGEQLKVTNPTPSVKGGQIRNSRSWAIKNTINPNTTPDSKFITQSWKWNEWEPWKKAHTIAFNWASDSSSKPFSWNQKARFSADFWVPTQASVSEGTVYNWVPSAAECPQTTQSPKNLVIRATSGG